MQVFSYKNQKTANTAFYENDKKTFQRFTFAVFDNGNPVYRLLFYGNQGYEPTTRKATA